MPLPGYGAWGCLGSAWSASWVLAEGDEESDEDEDEEGDGVMESEEGLCATILYCWTISHININLF